MSPIAQVADLADAIHPWAHRWKPLGMLYAYADDSGTHKASEVVVYGCLWGAKHDWQNFEGNWLKVLARYGLQNFHAAIVEARRHEYAHLRSTEAEALTLELARVIVDCGIRHVTAAIDRPAWDAVVDADPSASAFKERFRDPLHLGLEHCLQVTAEWSRLNAESEPVALMANNQGEAEATARDLYAAYQDSAKWNGILSGPFTFMAAKRFPPLQAADLVAREAHKHWMMIRSRMRPTWRTPWAVLAEKGGLRHARFYDRDGLLASMAQYRDRLAAAG